MPLQNNKQFELVLHGLHACDHHYISCSMDHILSWPAANQKAWLSGVHITCEVYLASEAWEVQASWSMMLNWFAQA
jgi:hypothetical protein